jgi:hypothetical protein
VDVVRVEVGVVTFSRSVTLTVWVMIAVGFVAAWIVSATSDGRFSSGLALLRMANRRIVVHIFVLAAWLWVGWHFFVRTTR